jgi:histidine triad (HIT) family protein
MDTIFDKIIRKEIPAEIIYEDDHVIVFLDIFPVNPGHTLFVPKEASENMMHTSEDSLAHLISVVKKLAPAILSAVGATDFNFTTNNGPVAGQAVMHTHFHFIPRFADDGYKLWGHKDSTKEEREEVQKRIIQMMP